MIPTETIHDQCPIGGLRSGGLFNFSTRDLQGLGWWWARAGSQFYHQTLWRGVAAAHWPTEPTGVEHVIWFREQGEGVSAIPAAVRALRRRWKQTNLQILIGVMSSWDRDRIRLLRLSLEPDTSLLLCLRYAVHYIGYLEIWEPELRDAFDLTAYRCLN